MKIYQADPSGRSRDANPSNEKTREEARLHAVRGLGLIDTPSEPTFDELATLAAKICAAPMALVTLVDHSRVWFKAHIGVEEGSVPRDESFSGFVLSQGDLLVIPDTLTDERFRKLPFVASAPHVRFYAGVALRDADGYGLGVLAVLDVRPRSFDAAQSHDLAVLGRQVVGQMLLRKHARELETEHKKLLQSSKMSSLGQMAAGVAHEINNPLAIITGKIHYARTLIDRGADMRDKLIDSLEKIEATALRVARIVNGLRAFSRSGEQDPLEEITLVDLLLDTLDLCQQRFRHHAIDLRLLEVPPLSLACQPIQLSQVLLNLLNNAFDAVVDTREPWVEISATASNDEVLIFVTDSGPGIAPEIVGHLAEPFFTTKPNGQGTGLGLNISRRIVEDHRGSLELNRDHPHTQFVVRLPLR